MKAKSTLGLGAVCVGIAALGVGLAPAEATPGSNSSVEALSLGNFSALDIKADKTVHWDLFLKTKDSSDIGTDRLTIQPDGHNGWHSHTGITLVTVLSGEIAWYDGNACSKTIYRTGDTFVEPANNVHLVANEGGVEAKFVAIQMRPTASRPRVDQPQPEQCSGN